MEEIYMNDGINDTLERRKSERENKSRIRKSGI